MNTIDSPLCPKCGAPLPADAPRRLCPRCLVAMNLATGTVLTGEPAPGAQPPLSPEEIAPHFPQLEILECLGRGGMGVVYKARQKALNRLVALKLLAPEREKDAPFAERFAREAQALAALSHPHIVTIHDFGQTNGFFYLLMEFVDGVNLRHLLSARKLTPEEALAIVPPICEALQFAHDRGIVHRDIKPENLLLAKDGGVKIADFGIAKMVGAEARVAEEKAAGTPGYMAPEQMETPSRVDSRADIYSLGVVFYEMLTGELPAAKIQPPSRKVQIDVRLDEIVLRALEARRELRFQTAAELRTEIETITSSAPEGSAPPKEPESNDANPWSRRTFWLVLTCVGLIPALLLFGIILPFFVILAHDNGVRLPGFLSPWRVILLVVFAAFIAFVGYRFTRPRKTRKASASPANPWPRRIFLLLVALLCVPVLLFFGLAVPYWLRQSQPPTRDTRATGGREVSAPQQIDFKVTRVEVPAGTRSIMLHFERDQTPGLVLEVFQDVVPAPDGREPARGHRTWRDKTRFAANSAERVMGWTLPAEFTEAEAAAAALTIEQKWKGTRALPEGAAIEFATVPHRDGWKYLLLARVVREPGWPHPAPPAGAAFTFEQQVAVPRESRVTVELFRKVNDGERLRSRDKLTFKTALGSGLGVLLRWHGYGPEHPTHANRWILDLIDPQNGTIFHRIEDGFSEAVKMTPLEGAAPGEGTHATLERAGSWVFLRLLRAERVAPPGEPVRAWWEVQAFVTLGAENQEGDPPLFQLPSSPAPSASPGSGADHGSPAPVASVRDPFTSKATEILQRLPNRALEIGPEDAVAEAAIQLAELLGVDSIANVTELKRLLKERAEGVENVGETIYWLLGFREKIRAQSKPVVVDKGAHDPKWLHGKWVFDLDFTKQKLAEADQTKAQGGLTELASALVVPQLISALEGSRLNITEKKFLMTTKDDNDKSFTYEVLEVPDADTVIVKMSDGEVNAFHREGERLWMTSSGNVNIRVYFLRAK